MLFHFQTRYSDYVVVDLVKVRVDSQRLLLLRYVDIVVDFNKNLKVSKYVLAFFLEEVKDRNLRIIGYRQRE